MNNLNISTVRDFFSKGGESLWIPTITRNAIIADEGFSSMPCTSVQGRVYLFHFKSIGGGMWEVTLRNLDGSER